MSEGGDPACWAHLLGDAGEPGPLTATELGAVLASDVVAHLATIDAAGFPRITPVRFEWDGEAFRIPATLPSGNASLLIITPNAQVQATGPAHQDGATLLLVPTTIEASTPLV